MRGGAGSGAEARLRAGRRELAYAVLLGVAGAGLAIWSVTRAWVVELASRPAPLPPVREVHTGADLAPWLPALALVMLAGWGAVLATRGWVRRLLGGVLAGIGAAVAAGGGYGLVAGLTGAVSRQWPLLCLLGGGLAVVAGVLTMARGGRWPAMGARYERRAGAPAGPVPSRRTADAWDALDRGADPTDE
ncbi:Trp biosynthesis-associated membrane protein [Salinispora arenicola]|uniref:Trp biosynthesis-associated membrane protein n=1 Tax=Salinispora arenicola TaxID=168697 RepID=UPI0016A6FF4A|nr:Trp biosynthesis-associated membrane protein [Salinispora arenicola]NIL60353.1 Trp biosynthesis-associated membrane protein [Salinispora arenicola]